jgi:dihydrolipoamide dehydrogenase
MKKYESFDLIIIGGGTAGVEVAFESTKLKKKTALIEPNFIGGICLNTGCIPTKTLLFSSHLYSEIRRAHDFGIDVPDARADFQAIMKRAKSIVENSRKSVELGLNNQYLKIFKEHAVFTGIRKVKVGDVEILGKKVIIAAGSKPHVPPIPGLQDVDYLVGGTPNNSKEDILNLEKFPGSLIIIGGGYIGFEFATFFSELGSKVTIIEGMDKVLGVVDDEIREVLLKKYVNNNFSILTDVKISKVSQHENKVTVFFADKSGKDSSVSGDVIFIATGRVPSSFELHPDKTNVEVDEGGAIRVNANLETSCKGVYAVGDITGKFFFAHTAKREGQIALLNAFGKKSKKFSTNAIPWAAFVDPPISGVGITENKTETGILKAHFSRAARAGIMGEPEGLLKIWFDEKTKKILGAQMIGPNSDDLIGEFSTLINCGGTVDNLREIIHIHPTLSEVADSLVEVKEK